VEERDFATIPLSADEREKFLARHVGMEDDSRAYIWFAFDNSGKTVTLWKDELGLTATMADEAGLDDFAARLRGMK
jgi:hypothetical protein